MKQYGVFLSAFTDDPEKHLELYKTIVAASQCLIEDNINVTVSGADSLEESEYFDEYTLFKVVNAFREAGVPDAKAEDVINTLQNAGILFRERR